MPPTCPPRLSTLADRRVGQDWNARGWARRASSACMCLRGCCRLLLFGAVRRAPHGYGYAGRVRWGLVAWRWLCCGFGGTTTPIQNSSARKAASYTRGKGGSAPQLITGRWAIRGLFGGSLPGLKASPRPRRPDGATPPRAAPPSRCCTTLYRLYRVCVFRLCCAAAAQVQQGERAAAAHVCGQQRPWRALPHRPRHRHPRHLGREPPSARGGGGGRSSGIRILGILILWDCISCVGQPRRPARHWAAACCRGIPTGLGISCIYVQR